MFTTALFRIANLWNHRRIDKETWHIYATVLFGIKKKQNYVTCQKMDRTRDHHVK
jgi:hypothetical protein